MRESEIRVGEIRKIHIHVVFGAGSNEFLPKWTVSVTNSEGYNSMIATQAHDVETRLPHVVLFEVCANNMEKLHFSGNAIVAFEVNQTVYFQLNVHFAVGLRNDHGVAHI